MTLMVLLMILLVSLMKVLLSMMRLLVWLNLNNDLSLMVRWSRKRGLSMRVLAAIIHRCQKKHTTC